MMPMSAMTDARVRGGLCAIALAVAVVGCGKRERQDGAAAGPGGAAVVVDVAAVNALVPAALKDALVFEKRELVIEHGKRKTTYTIAAPRDWVQRTSKPTRPHASTTGRTRSSAAVPPTSSSFHPQPKRSLPSSASARSGGFPSFHGEGGPGTRGDPFPCRAASCCRWSG